MRQAFGAIQDAGAAAAAEGQIAPVSEIFELQDMEGLKRLETRYLR